MTILGKKQMSEEDIKLNYITPVILDGWKGHVTMETKITDGRINISGNIVARSKPKFADYMLYLNDGKPIAAVEAKDNNHSVSHGLQQAMTYAQMMDLPFAYKYDEEWRMITGCIMKPPVMMKWIPSGIILGLRMDVAEENLVVSMAKEAGIKNIYKSYINAQNKLDAYPLKL